MLSYNYDKEYSQICASNRSGPVHRATCVRARVDVDVDVDVFDTMGRLLEIKRGREYRMRY